MNRQEAVLYFCKYTLKYTWKRTVISTAVVIAVVGTMVHYGSKTFGGDGTLLAAPGPESRQRISAPDPIASKETRPNNDAPGAEYGWGPLRLVDW
jgi:hypothetical protein